MKEHRRKIELWNFEYDAKLNVYGGRRGTSDEEATGTFQTDNISLRIWVEVKYKFLNTKEACYICVYLLFSALKYILGNELKSFGWENCQNIFLLSLRPNLFS